VVDSPDGSAPAFEGIGKSRRMILLAFTPPSGAPLANSHRTRLRDGTERIDRRMT
jgi:hypothetical protein